ncbi:MAG TPA: hypothetical protein VIH67_04875 [Candidatus Acidoferrum sp.]
MSTPAVSFLDVDLMDKELLRRGVHPDVIAKLASAQPSANAELIKRAGGTSATPPVSFMGPKPGPENIPAPDLQPQQPVGRAMSFVQPGQPATPAVSFRDNSAAQPSRDPHTTSRLQPGDLDRHVSQSNPADPNAQGSPRLSFVGSQNPQAGPQDDLAQVASTGQPGSVSNTAGLMRAATQPRSSEDEYRDLLKAEPTRAQFPAQKMPMWKKLLGAVASTAAGLRDPNVGGETARNFFSGPERKAEGQFKQAHKAWEGNVGNLMRAAKLRHDDLEDRNLQSEIDKRDKDKPDDPKDKKIDEGYNKEGQRVHVYQRSNGTEYTKVFPDIVQKQGSTEHKTPFEAYAYGTPEEKESAKNFLDLEHQFQRKYKGESEFEERYRLFKEHPEDYKAMFGDKGANRPDRGTATRMLNYFDKRRREVNSDFTLDDQQKQQQLQDIETLERPFLDAVQPDSAGANEDRVTVMHPDGRSGTIPRSQIEKAKKKGYRVQQ